MEPLPMRGIGSVSGKAGTVHGALAGGVRATEEVREALR
jgi:hypothetical protein